ncbi:DMT family transporter [Piscibacillus sp. B03]|uniref:DMT family transporter n=1 Tax=Piscibacillus sp. B03 TaxID=3457430 RepID=UPI003FCDCB7B
MSFYQGAVGLLTFFIWFLFRFKQNWAHSKQLYLWSILAGLGVAGNFTLYFIGIQSSSVAVAATLMYTAPVIVRLVSFLFRIERSTWFKWCCIVGVILGIILLTGAYNTESISVSFLGVAAGIGAGVSYAVFIFGFKNASSIGKTQPSLLIAFVTFCLILFGFSDTGEAAAVLSSSDLGWFILIGIIGSGLSFILYMIGIRRTTPTTASMVAMVEPVTASLFGVLILGDHLSIIQLLGMALILVTITVLSVKQSD